MLFLLNYNQFSQLPKAKFTHKNCAEGHLTSVFLSLLCDACPKISTGIKVEYNGRGIFFSYSFETD